jgi:type II secretory pathway component PulK
MGGLRSTRSCSRVRMSSRRGFALVAALVLAVLYFALVELLLLDSSRELAEARQFRARIVALTLAENAAELAAVQLAAPDRMTNDSRLENDQGKMEARMTKNAGGQFEIDAKGETSGVLQIRSSVRVRGRVVGNDVRIQYTIHSN